MTDYSKTVNFTQKDTLATGNSAKIVKGSEIDNEFDNISTAIATKINKVSIPATNLVAGDGSNGIADSGIAYANLPFESGTKMMFYQASAPDGWTLVSLSGTYAIMNDESNAGTVQGSDDPTALTSTNVPSHQHYATLYGANHAHTFRVTGTDGDYGTTMPAASAAYIPGTIFTLGSPGYKDFAAGAPVQNSGTLSVAGNTNANTDAANWTPRRACVRIASKD